MADVIAEQASRTLCHLKKEKWYCNIPDGSLTVITVVIHNIITFLHVISVVIGMVLSDLHASWILEDVRIISAHITKG
jgi:hypothetical protein